MLRLFLFGSPRVEVDGKAVPLRRTKTLALLAHLALTQQPQARDALTALLWPEFDEDSARNNLRRELSRIRTELGADLLVADRLQVGWNGAVVSWLDVVVFREQLNMWKQHDHASEGVCSMCAAALTTAVQLYRDDFMAGFNLPDSPAFDEWQFFEREELRQQLAAVLQALIGWHRQAGEYGTALAYARRWLALDRLHEPAHRELMELYAWTGQQAAALRQYGECARVLADEFGAEPEAETTALYEAIKARRLPVPAGGDVAAKTVMPPDDTRMQGALPAVVRAPRYNLPPQAATLVGREEELAALERLLADPDARLITIYGPGGIGKTRLAVELASRQRDAFADGVCFVALQPVAAHSLVSAIADASGCQLAGVEAPRRQLLTYLADRELLLLLDNFEHLLAGVELLGEILAAAPCVRLLVTSRETLNLREEWHVLLQGLALPPAVPSSQPESYAAVQLFVDRAQRVNPHFSLEVEREGVRRICRAVEGMPLALELAAAWTRTLSCDVIATEIERNLRFLATRLRDVPDRHRSVLAAFDHSWALLDEEEQAVFMRLSVFRGGFLLHAARAIAGATLPVLASLLDKSLLRLEHNGRYGIHELLRQYADERLRDAPLELAHVRQAHSAYYLGLLAERSDAMARGRQREAAVEIAAEFENIRLAWQQAVESADFEGILKACSSFGNVCLYRGLYQEGIATLEHAIGRIRAADPGETRDAALAHILNEVAWLYIRSDQLAAARMSLDESHLLYERLDEPPPSGRASDPLAGLSFVAMIEGNYAEAVRLSEMFLPLSQSRGYTQSVSFGWFVLARCARAQGLQAKARQAAQRAYAAAEAAGDRWFMAYVLYELGDVAIAEGRYEDARQHYQASYAIREEFDDREGMALALILQGKVALLQRDDLAARTLYEDGLALYPRTSDRGTWASALHGLGMAAFAGGEYRDAAGFFHEALELAREIQGIPLMLAILTSASELLLRIGRMDRALEVLVRVARHPAADHETGERAQQLLVRHGRELVGNLDGGAMQPEGLPELASTVGSLLAELAAPDQLHDTSVPALGC